VQSKNSSKIGNPTGPPVSLFFPIPAVPLGHHSPHGASAAPLPPQLHSTPPATNHLEPHAVPSPSSHRWHSPSSIIFHQASTFRHGRSYRKSECGPTHIRLPVQPSTSPELAVRTKQLSRARSDREPPGHHTSVGKPDALVS
jgi:hypothetical protein